MDRLEGTKELGYGMYPIQLRMLQLVAKTQRNPFTSAREHKAATDLPGQKSTFIFRLNEAGLRI
jgi:hypothetical protein